jgi:hypothetical protein
MSHEGSSSCRAGHCVGKELAGVVEGEDGAFSGYQA